MIESSYGGWFEQATHQVEDITAYIHKQLHASRNQ